MEQHLCSVAYCHSIGWYEDDLNVMVIACDLGEKEEKEGRRRGVTLRQVMAVG